MAGFKEQLLGVLGEIKGSGSFVSSDTKPFIFPGMVIRELDEIGFPINAAQVKDMIKVAHKAPFGKGSETILDTTVRSAWEIDATEIGFKNKDWGKFIEEIIEQIKPGLGLEGYSVTANLYKLLVYEKGDFFVTHKDSEKEKGMFGTLIIALPSIHTGGELLVRFDGREETIDLSEAANQYQIPYAAFYADCEHEIKPITSGYRVCLVYNLVQNKGAEKIEHNPLGSYAQRLAAILKTCEDETDMPKIVLLGHQYTPENFTMDALKLNDRPKAEALVQAAQIAGFYLKFGLVTSYQMGELEINSSRSSRSRRRSYYDDFYDDDDLENGTMGEIYDESINVKHWMEGGLPPLQNIQFEEKDLISAIKLNEDEPVEKEAEGYTGNAGMQMEYWYHYGAAFLWPKKYHYDVLINLAPDNKLEWIDYYNKQWKSLTAADKELAKQLAESCIHANNWDAKPDFTPFVNWLVNVKDAVYLSKQASDFLVARFRHITVENWMNLFDTYPYTCFEKIFTTVANSGSLAATKHFLIILNNLLANNIHAYKNFVLQQTEQLPAYLNLLNLSGKKEQATAKDILRNVLALGILRAIHVAWQRNVTNAFTKELTREYVNDVLLTVILESNEKTPIAKQIIAVCKEDLKHRVNNKPQPPADWSRSLPDVTSGYKDYKEVWKILSDFLQSPVLEVFDYQKAQGFRTEMENAIRNVTIDLKMETIKKKSPHTLRLTKTQAAYERDLAKWKIDVGLLEQVEGL